jgi:hypothetical protein
LATVVAVLLAATAGVGSAVSVSDTTRTVETTAIEPGETTTVTVSTVTGPDGGALTLNESFDGPVQDAALVNTTINGEEAGIGDYATTAADSSGVVVLLQGLPGNATVVVTYEVTANDSTGVIAVDGRFTDSEDQVSPDRTTIDVAADPLTANQTVDEAEVVPGETITATVTVTNPRSNLTVDHAFEPALANTSISATVDGSSVLPVVAADSPNGTVVTLDGLNASETVSVSVTVTVPETVSAGTNVTISGDVTSEDATAEFETRTVSVVEPDPLERFDPGEDGIGISDLGKAADAFARGELTIAELGEIASAFAA